MKKGLLLLFITLLLSSCPNKPGSGPDPNPGTGGTSPVAVNEAVFNLNYINGSDIPFGNKPSRQGEKCYAIWLEDEQGNFIRNIFVCQKVTEKPNGNILLPYWESKNSEVAPAIDAVTGATHKSGGSKNTDFTIDGISLKAAESKRYRVCFEIARSWDPNDWFTASEQPSVIYSTLINLDALKDSYNLAPTGWYPTSQNRPGTGITIAGWQENVLNSEIRYITHKRNGDNSFGPEDTSEAATLMVGSIKLTKKSSK